MVATSLHILIANKFNSKTEIMALILKMHKIHIIIGNETIVIIVLTFLVYRNRVNPGKVI